MKQTTLSCLSLLGLSVLLLLGSGCADHRPRKYAVQVTPLVGGSIAVDIVGATAVDLPDWTSYSINKYWQPGNPRRRDTDKITLKLDSGKPQELSATDPIWDRWLKRGVDHLVVIADIPGAFEDTPDDPRRKSLDLDPTSWKDSPKQLQVEIQESRIFIRTPVAPKK